ncbi:MAG: hypothetical protein EHM91_00070 [Planctomycetota bacterium]|nr:MAG: hypothetical protein EHM91_00070 [Planctomycetota bacterium]
MAVTGVFAADFSEFNKAVQESQSRLKGFEGAAGSVESSLRLMTQSQEQMLDQIGAAGGRIGEVSQAASAATGPVKGLGDSYKQFDGILQAVGVNIGPQVKGLEDLAAASGKTASQFGVLGTAGLAAGAFMTGWKIGEFIDGLTGASAAVQTLVEKLGLWQNLSDETAGAKQDTINLAIRNGAAATISYTEAIKFNQEAFTKNAAAKVDWREKLVEAHREVRNLTEAQKADIAVMQEAGATTADITAKHGLHALGLKLLTEQIDANTAAQKKLNEERAKEAEASAVRNKANAEGVALMERDARLAADRAKFDAEQLAIQTQKLEAGKGYVAQMGEVARVNQEATTFEKNLATERAALEVENQKIIASMGGMTEAHGAAGAAAETGTAQTVAGYQAVQQQVELTSDGIRAWLALMQYTAKANAILKQNGLFTTTSQYEQIGNISIPSFAGGVEQFAGGLAKVHGGEVLANLAPGTSVYPKGSGLGATVNNTFNLVDSESNLARRVAELIMRQVRAGTQLGTT